MSVTAAGGFVAAGVAAGIKSNGGLDVAVVVNNGPNFDAAGVFTSNRVKAAPVLWSEQVLKTGELRAVVLNSGGANACTGPDGFADTHRTAEHAAKLLTCGAGEVAVCSTGLIGERLPMDAIVDGVSSCIAQLSDSDEQGRLAAQAIMTTDTVSKVSTRHGAGYTIGGMAKGAGMLAPGLATMLVVITTDADVSATDLQSVLAASTRVSFDRIDSDGCMSTNDTVLLLASGASGVTPDLDAFGSVLTDVCADLARQLIADAEGASKDIRIVVGSAASEQDAVVVARSIARNNLLKCAIHGEDPNWGRVLAAIGTTDALFEPDQLDVAINDVWVCRGGTIGDDRSGVDMSNREVLIRVELNAGDAQATVWTNDLTSEYVHENSAYST